MTYLTRFRDNCRVNLPGALDGAIDVELFNVIDEMCRTVPFDLREFNADLVAGDLLVTVTPPANTTLLTVFTVSHVLVDGIAYDPDEKRLIMPSAVTAEQAASPVIVEASVAPAPGATAAQLITDRLWERGYDCILSGVLGRMMAQPAKPYTNPVFAVNHIRRFRQKMSLLADETLRAQQPGATSWRFPSFA